MSKSVRITRVDAPGVQGVLGDLEQIALDLETAGETLRSTVEPLDGCWGDDKNGKTFDEFYRPVGPPTLDNSKTIVDGVHDSHENLKGIVGAFQDLDESAGGVLELSVDE